MKPTSPDKDAAPTAGDPAPGETRETVSLGELLLAQQREGWESGQRKQVEAYLQQYPELVSDEQTLIDLIYNEYVLRVEMGEHPRPEEYFERFPQCREPLRRQLAFDQGFMGAEASVDAALDTSVAPEAPAPAPAPGAGRIGKYPLVALLDEGGQALVYRAVHPELGRDVVIKLSRVNRPGHGPEQERLREEGRILAELEHPNLARVFDLDTDDGRIFLVMEYVRGQNLDQFARTAKPTPIQAARLIAQIARALALVHSKGVVHLDVKPRNILIEESGRPRLIDFGLARWRQCWSENPAGPEMISGTVAYMAPEQARGESERIGAVSDVFALGGVLYFLLTGKPLFGGGGLAEMFQRARSCSFDRTALNTPEIPPRLAAVCLRALSADPAGRYARADDLAADLEAFLRPSRPRRVWVVAGVAVAALLAVLLMYGAGFFRGPVKPVTQPPAEHAGLKLRVRVRTGDDRLDLLNAVPLRTKKDALHIQIAAHDPDEVSLFLFTSKGQLRRLEPLAPEVGGDGLCYPGEGGYVPLTGPAGTEFLLACGRVSGPAGLAEASSCFAEGMPWPALPAHSVLRLLPDKVVVEEHSRDLGPPNDGPDPETEVRRRLEDLRLRLLEKWGAFEGLAFAHED